MLHRKFQMIEKEMNSQFMERMEIINGILLALLSKNHVLLLGPPGTGKSAMIEELCSRIGGKYFKKLLSRTSTPEELFGPISLKALEQDSYRRVTTGRLPEAQIAFIDEIFKCNSAVLNGLLSVLNEREFENGGSIVKVPLQFLAGSSNEFPEDRMELSAIWDRFLIRQTVKYIRDPRNFELLLTNNNQGQTKTTISETELATAQTEVDAVDVTGIIALIYKIREKMMELRIEVSDRRWKQCLGLIKASAWMNGRNKANDTDIEILTYALWQETDQIPAVRQKVMELCNPYEYEAQNLLDSAVELYQIAMSVPEEKKISVGTETVGKLKGIIKKLGELQKIIFNAGNDDTKVKEYIVLVQEYNKETISKNLGLSTS